MSDNANTIISLDVAKAKLEKLREKQRSAIRGLQTCGPAYRSDLMIDAHNLSRLVALLRRAIRDNEAGRGGSPLDGQFEMRCGGCKAEAERLRQHKGENDWLCDECFDACKG